MKADAVMRATVADMPLPALPGPAFTTPPPVPEARVAVVTTAGLMRHGEAAWDHDDPSFRTFHRDERDLMIGHVSMSFDRSGAILDRNVVVPIDRLSEMASAGLIGSVADRHLSFMGALRAMDLLTTVVNDSGRVAAEALRADDVDVVLITPMCPGCSRTVTVLGHVLENEGLATVVLASNPAITERARPPRALLCDFPLGRPLGRPMDPAFQRRVLAKAFALLDRKQGPVLERFPEVIEDEADVPMGCPLPGRCDPDVPAAVDEARALRPAWERTRDAQSNSHVGRRVDADAVPAAIERFLRVSRGTPWKQIFTDADELFQTAADVRVYYEEAALGLASGVPAARASEAWFYQRTQTGQLFRDVVGVLQRTGQEDDLGLAGVFYLVPLSQYDGDRVNPPWEAGMAPNRR
jgi:D-proline reductase (dithiol) PrdB